VANSKKPPTFNQSLGYPPSNLKYEKRESVLDCPCNPLNIYMMGTIETKAAIAAQIAKLNASQNVQQAKSWWSSLTPAQKALALAIIAGSAVAAATYFGTVGAASAVVVNGVATPGAAITTAQAFWTAVVAGSLAGGLAGYLAYSHYSTADADVIAPEFNLND